MLQVTKSDNFTCKTSKQADEAGSKTWEWQV
jgi:hypothetical protein